MKQEYAKRFLTKDGKKRLTIYWQEYPEDPRDMTDEPLHCEDWSRDYSIMNKQERETKSEDACKLIRHLLTTYGDNKKIVKLLKDNYKDSEHDRYENGLSYDRSRKEWIVWSWQPTWKDYQGNVCKAHWEEEWSFCTNIYDVDIYNIVDILSDEQIDTLCDEKYWTDGIKICSYGFGYYGGISFYDSFSTDSEGICWLEKDEFMKYSGNDEKYWKSKTLTEIEWLCKEISAWADDEVYGYVVEHKKVVKVTETYEDGTSKEYERIDWEEGALDSCWGFYGELDDEHIGYILESAGFKKDELDEA